ncbi:MAG: hypothetical protein ACI8T1_003525, partial [Verrucomicrobiales bacterium]
MSVKILTQACVARLSKVETGVVRRLDFGKSSYGRFILKPMPDKAPETSLTMQATLS